MAKTIFNTPPVVEAKHNLKKELILLDFVEHDTIDQLKYLITLFEENKADGMIFAVSLKHERTRNHVFGASGKASVNLHEGIAMGALLQHFLVSLCVK